jgi:hypothetical protein
MLRLFRATGFFWAVAGGTVIHHRDGTHEQVDPAYPLITEAPTDAVTVWRGASLASKGRGFSFSAYRECALKFAERSASTGCDAGLFRAVVPPYGVLALFGDDREQEVVINPNVLRGRVELIEAMTSWLA